MKNLSKLTTFLLIMFYTALYGCRVETIDPPQPEVATPAVILASTQGAQAASQLAQTRELVMANTLLLKNLGDFAISVMTPGLPNQNTDIACADGGAFQYSGTENNGTYSLTLQFNGCRDKGYQYVGSVTATGTPAILSLNLGGSSTLNIFNFNTSYTVLLAYLKTSLNFTVSGAGNSTDASYTIKVSSGTITSFDYFLLDTFTMSFSNLTTDYVLATNPATRDQTTMVSANGRFKEQWGAGSHSIDLVLTNFQVDTTKLFDATTGSFYAQDASMNGTAAYTIRPSAFGFSGMLNVSTQTPVRTLFAASNNTTQGLLTINDNTFVKYNSGGDIDVTVTGNTSLHYAKSYDLMKICDYAAMEQDKPELIAPPGAGGAISTSGSNLAVTLTWTGPAPTFASASDMDLHIKYYNDPVSNPTATETWHVDWHQGVSCTAPAGLDFSKAGIDIDGDGICDVGLDFDDVDGFGPEHVTALKIPAGYYVISVNSFDLHGDASAELYLSLNIGDLIIGPYRGSLSTADGESTDSNSWLRVADVRVNADGTIDVLAPDPNFMPWH